MPNCYNLVIVPLQCLEEHTNRYRSLAERTQSYQNSILNIFRVHRVQNIYLLPILHRLVCTQKSYFSSSILSAPLTPPTYYNLPLLGNPSLWCLLWSRLFEVCFWFHLLVQWWILKIFPKEPLNK